MSLAGMFGPSRQLILQHVMYDPAWDDACPSCSAGLDEMSAGLLRNMRARDTAFAGVSRAPYAKIAAYKERQGWDFSWYSSFGSDFNYDFNVSIDPAVTPVMFNYRDEAELKAAGFGWVLDGPSEQPGVSCFLKDGDEVFSHLFDLRTRHRAVRRRLRLPRHHGPRPAGGMGGAEGPRARGSQGHPGLRRVGRSWC